MNELFKAVGISIAFVASLVIVFVFVSYVSAKMILSMYPGPSVQVLLDGKMIFFGPQSQIKISSAGISTTIDIYKGKGWFTGIEKTYTSKDIEVKTVENK